MKKNRKLSLPSLKWVKRSLFEASKSCLIMNIVYIKIHIGHIWHWTNIWASVWVLNHKWFPTSKESRFTTIKNTYAINVISCRVKPPYIIDKLSALIFNIVLMQLNIICTINTHIGYLVNYIIQISWKFILKITWATRSWSTTYKPQLKITLIIWKLASWTFPEIKFSKNWNWWATFYRVSLYRDRKRPYLTLKLKYTLRAFSTVQIIFTYGDYNLSSTNW